MKKSLLSLSGLIVIVMFCNSCTKDNSTLVGLYTPTVSDVTSTATLSDLQQGRKLYINNCGACHSVYSPDNFSASNWRAILPAMLPRTGLSQAQGVLVTKYVTRGK